MIEMSAYLTVSIAVMLYYPLMIIGIVRDIDTQVKLCLPWVLWLGCLILHFLLEVEK